MANENEDKLAAAMALAEHYRHPIEMPKDMKEGLGNAIQMALNQIAVGNLREAVLNLVDIIDDVRGKSNPYEISVRKLPKKKENGVSKQLLKQDRENWERFWDLL